ncbi:MAG: bacillithiol biosynthesis deacetylase BshB1 [Bacteroidia bacterium]|nr:bacillithiol biosynthesis deacetylase BshB1 [Bacteroidia bacterium]MDW8302050.1 bacillithiol biosynthesis deacetylase BshB1 [Bacteroidia bacterium]
MHIDILAFAAHPDDAELGCAGILYKAKQQGYTTGICDLTQGELGTRGTPEIRQKEAEKAKEILQLDLRINAKFRDGFFNLDEYHIRKIIEIIRTYTPTLLLVNAPEDRHPDHGKACRLVKEAAFLSGLQRIETVVEGTVQKAHRPEKIYSYIQDKYLEPDIVVDITDVWAIKQKAILAYQSQFYNPNSNEPQTYISTPHFLQAVVARAQEMGHKIYADYGEGLIAHQKTGITKIQSLFLY